MRIYFILYALSASLISLSGADEKPVSRTVFLQPELLSQPEKMPATLNDSGNYFFYRPTPPIRVSSPLVRQIDQVCRQMPLLDKEADQLLSKNGECSRFLYLPEWGAVYANLPRMTGQANVIDQNTAKYALALLFVRRYRESEKTLLKVLQKTPDDYGALILLGLLSTRKKEYFPYLEKAVAISPLKSMLIVDWHCDNLDMLYKLPEEWDFINAYIRLVLQYRHVLKGEKISQMMANRLLQVIRKRYFDADYRVLPKYEADKTGLEQLNNLLIPSLTPSVDVSS